MIKILPADKTRLYELTYLINTELTQAQQKEIYQQVEDLIKKHHGLVVTQEDWGKRELAYKIRQGSKLHIDAFYQHLVIEIPAETVNDLEKDLNLSDTLIRHLLVLSSGQDKKELKASPNSLENKNDDHKGKKL
jgi:small subunit ribosomal protein S6